MTYLQWNDALVRYFFRPELAGQPVWLYVSEDVVEQVGVEDACGDVASFVAAVREGPPWATARTLCQRALQALDRWRDRHLEHPPYVAYLALFVLAAGREGDFARHAYYPRLRVLLGETGDGALPSFARMLDLWDDLERWSMRDRNGEVGLFEARIVGGHIHVGLPIAQTILSQDERRALPQMFADAGLDPTSPPPDDELARMLRSQAGTLRPRTRQLVRTASDPESYEVLLDTVAEELARWDGTYGDHFAEGPGAHRKFGSIRLCVSFDRVSGRLSAYLRCRAMRDLPASLLLAAQGLPPLSFLETGLPGWSSPLINVETGQRFNAVAFDWTQSLSLAEERSGWRFALPPRRVRIFVPGVTEALPDFIELQHVPRAQSVHFMYRDLDWPQLAAWAEHDCREFRPYAAPEGAPPGWRLASCSEVLSDRHARASFRELVLPDRIRLTLAGGIRSTLGNNFFQFAPPGVLLEGGDGREVVTCDGRVLVAAGPGRSYLLPDGLPAESRITLEALRDGQAVKRLSIYLTGAFEWRHTRPQQAWTSWRNAASPGDAAVAGALVVGPRPQAAGFESAIMLTPGLHLSSRRILFLGRAPGQIYSWPGEPPAASWRPVWAVPMGRGGSAIFCGRDLQTDAPLPQGPFTDRHRVRLWKETLWHRRKRITEPQEPPLATLWRSYVEAARHV